MAVQTITIEGDMDLLHGKIGKNNKLIYDFSELGNYSGKNVTIIVESPIDSSKGDE